MKKDYRHYAKVFGLVVFYFLVFIFTVFLTMETLIKGEELNAPLLVGKTFSEAERIAEEKKVYLKKIVGTYDKHYKPNVIFNQVPSAGLRIKEKSIIKVFVPSEVVEVVMPNLVGLNVSEIDRLLRENDLTKRYVSYINSADVPVDVVISQSFPSGTQIPRGTGIDILASNGIREVSYIMPDLIGQKADNVMSYFDQLGLKIASPIKVSYPGVDSGIVIKQYPLSGFQINSKARISIEVSK